MFRDLSEAFDKISHELLPAKLHAYNLSDKPPNLTYGYFMAQPTYNPGKN